MEEVYAICEEIINGNPLSGCFTIRVGSDTCSARFSVRKLCNTFEEAVDWLPWFRKQHDYWIKQGHAEEYFNK